MDEHLASLLGIDPDDPDVQRAHEDAEALMQLIQTLVAHRKSAKLTQKAVAAEMETTQSAVSEFERLGGDPRLSTIMRYARAVGLKIYVKAHTDHEVARPSSSWTQVAETEERVPNSSGRRKAA
ncbi:helix-turn-helix domain-containing protein [Kitasatospora sp. NPDC058032]|uniref:helix-turn-helix domain-containing protein n=1 Tax=unclassified Kitasatospora TaxID=2633591 RepID=UPI00339DED01